MSRNMWRTNGKMNFPLDGLELYLPLWHPELSGSPILSKDTNQHSCAVTGATHVPPTHRSFDGADDWITVPYHASLDALSAFSIIAWVYLDAGQPSWSSIFGGDAAATVAPWAFRAHAVSADVMEFQIIIKTAGSLDWQNSATDSGVQTWLCVGASYDGTTMTNFLAGVPDGSSAHANPGNAVADGSDYRIGAYLDGAGDVKGDIGEIWIWSRKLIPLEFDHVYLATRWRYV
ncbi:hypothetical protein LCGC14_2490580 [marine sediment metagenome]|uniref:LamG-like jellyroll fold domain-containing protein n=1 Tax=marine sediment metagenome TaxID=412755 RepID=A0A0F9DGP8_9ZZZZ